MRTTDKLILVLLLIIGVGLFIGANIYIKEKRKIELNRVKFISYMRGYVDGLAETNKTKGFLEAGEKAANYATTPQ